MKLVVDTNIVTAALIRNSTTRKLIFYPEVYTYTPEHVIAEIDKHRTEINRKSRLNDEEFSLLYDKIISEIEIVPIDEYKDCLQDAYDIMKNIDENDTPFLALAMSFENEGIWSQDAHMKAQQVVKVWTTKDLIVQFDIQ